MKKIAHLTAPLLPKTIGGKIWVYGGLLLFVSTSSLIGCMWILVNPLIATSGLEYLWLYWIAAGAIFISVPLIILWIITSLAQAPFKQLVDLTKEISLRHPDIGADHRKKDESANLYPTPDALLKLLSEQLTRCKKNNDQLTSTINALPDLLFELDKKGYIFFFHVPHDVELYLPHEQWNQKPITETLPEEAVNVIFESLAEASREGISRGCIYNLVMNHKVRWYELSAVRKGENLGNDTRFIVLIREVTQWMTTENELQETNNRLSAANHQLSEKKHELETILKELEESKKKADVADRMKTAFLSNMSHEIRTPMNAIMGFTDLLINEELPLSDRKQYQQIIQARAEDLMSIINGILDISKIEAGSFQVTHTEGNLRQLLRDIEQSYKNGDNENRKSLTDFKLFVELTPQQCHISTDFARVKQVLTHLIDNAFKFTDQGCVESGCRLTSENELLFWVKDTGIGIDMTLQDEVFKRFRQANDPRYGKLYGGTGLGLSIAQGIITQMNGKIWFDSKPNIGTTFYFTIPYIPVPSKSAKPMTSDN